MALRRAVAALLLAFAVLVAARGIRQKTTSKQTEPPKRTVPARTTPAATPKSAATAEKQIAQRWLRGMSLRDQIAQLIVVTSYGELPPSRSQQFKQFAHWIRDLHVGGIIVVNRVINGAVRPAEPYAMAAFLNRMQKMSKIPLMVGGDFERGASMRVSGTTKYPHMMAYGAANDLAMTRALGAATAEEARALGVHWVFAPVADVNNNPENPIINIRSFGEDPNLVSAHVRAYIEGAHSNTKQRVLVTVKHFPGHGDTAVDSHMGMATIAVDRARMDQVELVPFRAAIQSGVDAVMTAHLAVPSIEPQEIPATVSNNVLTGLLRKDLAFDGLIVTDAMDMRGLTTKFPGGEAAVRALIAGADVLLMPPSPDEAIKSVMAAIREGRLTKKQIEQSALKVLAAKARVGLHRGKLVDVDNLSDVLDDGENADKAQAVADKAVTVVKNEGSALPVTNRDEACVYVLSESRYGQQGRVMMEEIRRRSKTTRAALLDPQVPLGEIDQLLQKAGSCKQHVIAAFVTAAAYRGNVALTGNYVPLVEGLLKSGTPVSMVALGNPYLLRSFPGVAAYMATFSTAPPSETAAVKAVFGEIPISGKLPVSIPGFAKVGDGLTFGAAAAPATTGQSQP